MIKKNKEAYFTVRCNKEELSVLKKIAYKEERTISGLIRFIIKDYLRKSRALREA